MVALSDSMIRSAQVWAAAEPGARLQLCSSLVEPPSTNTLCGELVARIEKEQAPIIVRPDYPGANGHAHREALLGMPVIAEGNLRAVLVLDLICPESGLGAIEIWGRDQRDELGLNGAVFSNLGRFANISQHVRFPRGSGLPGLCWEHRETKLLTGIGRSPNFMRAAGARAGGLDLGIALPVMTTEHDLHSVILFLSSQRTPIARAFEVWDLDSSTSTAKLRNFAGANCEAYESESKNMLYSRNEGVVGAAWQAGLPLIAKDLAAIDKKRAASAAADGISTAIAFPVFVGEYLKSVFIMLN